MHPASDHPRDSLLKLVTQPLDAAEAAEVELHLQACEACKTLLEDLRAMKDAGIAPDVKAPPELLAGLLEEVRATTPPIRMPTPGPSRRQLGIHFAYAAVVAGLLIVSGVQYRHYVSSMKVQMLPPADKAGGPATQIQPDQDRPYVLLGLPIYVGPDGVPWYRAEIRRDDGLVWSVRILGDALRHSTKGSIVLAVPTISVPPGRYKLYFGKDAESLGEPVLFDIVR